MALRDISDLQTAITGSAPIIAIDSYEELRAIDLIVKASKKSQLPVYSWACTQGLTRIGLNIDYGGGEDTRDALAMIDKLKSIREPSLFILCDTQSFMVTPYADCTAFIRGLKDLAQGWRTIHHKIILLSHQVMIPPELSRMSMRLSLSMPNREETLAIVKEEARAWSASNSGERIKTDHAVLERAVNSLQGMTFEDTRRLARGMLDDGAITDCDLPEINRMKYQLMDMDSVLSFEYDTERFDDVAGLDNLKGWLEHRQPAFLGESDLDSPRGVMLLGVQGAGKSLAAKAIAGAWGVALMRLDFGALFNKYIGETERQLREALKTAEAMSPCVLWIDEIEKGLSQGSDEGTGRRTLGTLLTWLSEHKSNVFLVATSNDIRSLPPELVRKGRLDEIFFVDLPDASVRAEIFAIHLKKRDVDLGGFDCSQLASYADQFSGAEIEQAVISALYKAQARNDKLDQQLVIDCLTATQPLSVVMQEQLTELREWADGRTVPA